jgi:hypothetical protein
MRKTIFSSDGRACASREGKGRVVVDIAHCTNKQALERPYPPSLHIHPLLVPISYEIEKNMTGYLRSQQTNRTVRKVHGTDRRVRARGTGVKPS